MQDLFADARTAAQKLANAAGASVGPIQAITDANFGYYAVAANPPSSFGSFQSLIRPTSSAACGAFTTGSGTTTSVFSNTGVGFGYGPSCAITVTFSLIPAP